MSGKVNLDHAVTPLKSHRHRMTTQMAQGGFPLIKAELRIELYDISNKMAMQNKTFFADIDPIDIKLDLSPIKSSSSPYIDEDLVEMTFDVTKLYNASKNEGLDTLKFKIRLLRGNRRVVKALSRASIKAFIIIYEKLKSCGFQDAFQKDARAKRSRDIHLENENVQEGNSSLGLNTNEEEHCHKRDSFVTFAEKGMNFVIYPSYYRTSDCVLDLATPPSPIQTDLRKERRRGRFACCVPTDYDSLTMVFEDVKHDGRPVMSKFNDIAAKHCGCRLV
ncbi:uncharacterized protein LOC129963873 isoform X2 [Argiope bruennichi]|uniref:uncharacterized protein LOC129963873 isoform X2 n=1 Tax=Argiope bruennichi TaxID=94029 RepID=UPI0024947EB8|nr:uncharacterized protein LOC129963873 isoform X2 [Argiope bruennichi]